MKTVHQQLCNLTIPMLEDSSGQLFCTSEVLSKTLGISLKTLQGLLRRHRDQFTGLTVPNRDGKDPLWTKDGVILVATLSRSSVSQEFRHELVELIKKNATRRYL